MCTETLLAVHTVCTKILAVAIPVGSYYLRLRLIVHTVCTETLLTVHTVCTKTLAVAIPVGFYLRPILAFIAAGKRRREEAASESVQITIQ